MERTSSEKVDVFAVSYIILPSVFLNHVAWAEVVRERYHTYLTVSNHVFSNASSLSQAVFSGGGSFDTLSSVSTLIEKHKLQPLFEQLCGSGEQVLVFLACWLQFLTNPEFAVRHM
jgi:hypothetical protein